MTYSKTNEKLLKCLEEVYLEYKGTSRKPIASFFRKRKLAQEYSRYLHEDGLLTILVGGERGPATRKWVGSKPTISFASKYNQRFCDQRAKGKTGRTILQASHGLSVHQKLDLILDYLRISGR